MKLTKLLLPVFLIAVTLCVQASRQYSRPDKSDYASGIEAIADFSSTVAATTGLFTSLAIQSSGISIVSAPRSMWGE